MNKSFKKKWVCCIIRVYKRTFRLVNMIKILVCDDETFARDAMAKIIRRKGFDVVVASNGEECIDLYKKEKPDVVFSKLIIL